MRIVDAQIHIWESGLPSNIAHRQVTAFTVEEAVGLMNEGGIDAAVLHPPSWDPGGLEVAFEAVRTHPDRFAILGSFPLDRPESRSLVEHWRRQPGMLGLRYTFLHEPLRGWLLDGTLDWLWAAAERAGVPIAVLATDTLPQFGRIAERHPGLRLIVDHMGIFTRMMDDAIEYWVEETIELAKHPNIFVKVSAIPSYSSQPYPFENVNKYVRMVVEAFGAKRCFWGTDLTRQLNHGLSYTDCIEHFTKHMGFTQEQLEWIMGRGISDCLEWPASR